MAKFAKSEVQFEHPAHGKEQCGKCKHFEVRGPKMCEIVAGKVLAGDWCNKYEKSYRLAKVFKGE